MLKRFVQGRMLWFLGSGLGVGLLLAAPLYTQSIWLWFRSLPKWMTSTYSILHVPAGVFAMIWARLGLPPHGDASFSLYTYGVVLQWLLIGGLVGVWYCRKG